MLSNSSSNIFSVAALFIEYLFIESVSMIVMLKYWGFFYASFFSIFDILSKPPTFSFVPS
jgi:hypothetical protein